MKKGAVALPGTHALLVTALLVVLPSCDRKSATSAPSPVSPSATSFSNDADANDVAPFTGEWTGDDDGWVAGFSDYPPGVEREWHFDSRRAATPAPLSSAHRALFIGGDNHSDDLFMFWKRKVTGLAPGHAYAATLEVVFGTNAPKSCSGVGGAPGESVYVKAGASSAEPQTRIGSDGAVRMTIDKGEQRVGGKDAVLIGNVATTNTDCLHRRWEEKRLATGSPIATKADASGAVWVIVATDSGFEARSELYYETVRLRLDAK
jgi:hypothetical protein